MWTAAALMCLAAPETRSYRFSVEYVTFDAKGGFLQKQRIAGIYTAANPGEPVRWSRVTMANGASLSGAYAAEEPQAYMEGFTYQPDAQRLFTPDFFKGFPSTATQARNLVWDTYMLETFAENLKRVKDGSPYHLPSWAVPLAGTGTFKNTDIQLTWMGVVERSRKECALIKYEAFFNTVDHTLPGARLSGRSDYWGEIWIPIATGDIEWATLYEEVIGELTIGTPPTTRGVNVVRKGTFERIVN